MCLVLIIFILFTVFVVNLWLIFLSRLFVFCILSLFLEEKSLEKVQQTFNKCSTNVEQIVVRSKNVSTKTLSYFFFLALIKGSFGDLPLPPRNPVPRTMSALEIEFRFYCTKIFGCSTIDTYIWGQNKTNFSSRMPQDHHLDP